MPKKPSDRELCARFKRLIEADLPHTEALVTRASPGFMAIVKWHKHPWHTLQVLSWRYDGGPNIAYLRDYFNEFEGSMERCKHWGLDPDYEKHEAMAKKAGVRHKPWPYDADTLCDKACPACAYTAKLFEEALARRASEEEPCRPTTRSSPQTKSSSKPSARAPSSPRTPTTRTRTSRSSGS